MGRRKKASRLGGQEEEIEDEEEREGVRRKRDKVCAVVPLSSSKYPLLNYSSPGKTSVYPWERKLRYNYCGRSI